MIVKGWFYRYMFMGGSLVSARGGGEKSEFYVN